MVYFIFCPKFANPYSIKLHYISIHIISYTDRAFSVRLKNATVIQRRHVTMELYNAVITAEVHFTINKHHKRNQKLPLLDDVSWFAEKLFKKVIQGNIGKIDQGKLRRARQVMFCKAGFIYILYIYMYNNCLPFGWESI